MRKTAGILLAIFVALAQAGATGSKTAKQLDTVKNSTGGGSFTVPASAAPAASSVALWDANLNLSANALIPGYTTTTTAAGTTTLTVASTGSNFYTGTNTQTVVMPVVSTLVLGEQFLIENLSTKVVTVQSSGANTIQAMAGGGSYLVLTVILTTGTTAASWSVQYGYLSGGFLYPATGSAYGGTNSNLAITGIDNFVTGQGAGTGLTSGTNNTLVGFNAGNSLSTALNNVCVGAGSCGANITTTTGNSNVFVGSAATASAANTQMVVIGNTAAAGGQNDVAIGFHAVDLTSNTGAIAIGSGAGADGGGVAIGLNATASSNTSDMGVAIGSGSSATSDSVAIGFATSVSGGNSVAVGSEISVSGAGAEGIGASITVSHNFCFSAGESGFATAYDPTTAANQITFGTATNAMADLYLGNGAKTVATPTASTIRPTGSSGTNIAGVNLTLLSGNGTGSGGSGSINFQTAPVAASSSTADTYAIVGSIANTGAWTLGAASGTPTHSLNTATATAGSGVGTFTNLPTGFSGNPTGYISITINGVAHIIPYW